MGLLSATPSSQAAGWPLLLVRRIERKEVRTGNQ
jgi:hypothetical protein